MPGIFGRGLLRKIEVEIEIREMGSKVGGGKERGRKEPEYT
jgi:hypothetical protein